MKQSMIMAHYKEAPKVRWGVRIFIGILIVFLGCMILYAYQVGREDSIMLMHLDRWK